MAALNPRDFLAHEVRRYLRREVSLEVELGESLRRPQIVLANTGPSPSEQAPLHELEVRLAGVLARLPDDYRQVIVQRNLEGLSHEEVAARMGRGVEAV